VREVRAPLLEVKNLSKRFGGVVAVSDFSFALGESELVGIIGPNGAGKTTVLNLVSGLYRADSGQILFAGSDITSLQPWRIARLGVSRTFQNIRLFEGLTVLENVKVPRGWHSRYGFLRALGRDPWVGREEREIQAQAQKALDLVGLAGYSDALASSLPYGLQRRVELARALASSPRLLLLDEPAAGLNPQEVRELIELIGVIRRELGLAIILIEHRMEVIMELCDWIYVLDFGRLIAQGTPSQVREDPVVIKAYLGEEFE